MFTTESGPEWFGTCCYFSHSVYVWGNPSTHIYTPGTLTSRHNIECLAFFPFLTCQMYTQLVHLFPPSSNHPPGPTPTPALTTFPIPTIPHIIQSISAASHSFLLFANIPFVETFQLNGLHWTLDKLSRKT